MSNIAISEITNEIQNSSELDGNELFLISDVNNNLYTSKKLKLSKFKDYVNSGVVPVNNQDKVINQNGVYSADAGYTGLGTIQVNVRGELDQGIITCKSSSNNKVGCVDNYFSVIQIGYSQWGNAQTSMKLVNTEISNSSVYTDIEISNTTPTNTNIDNCVIYVSNNINIAYSSGTSVISLYTSNVEEGIKLNCSLFTYLKIITPTAVAETDGTSWGVTNSSYSVSYTSGSHQITLAPDTYNIVVIGGAGGGCAKDIQKASGSAGTYILNGSSGGSSMALIGQLIIQNVTVLNINVGGGGLTDQLKKDGSAYGGNGGSTTVTSSSGDTVNITVPGGDGADRYDTPGTAPSQSSFDSAKNSTGFTDVASVNGNAGSYSGVGQQAYTYSATPASSEYPYGGGSASTWISGTYETGYSTNADVKTLHYTYGCGGFVKIWKESAT